MDYKHGKDPLVVTDRPCYSLPNMIMRQAMNLARIPAYMEPAESGDWVHHRPKQLVFLTGLDPANKKSHKTLADTFITRSPSSLPLNLRLVSGELDLPGKRALALDKGILRLDWPTKYLERVPALIVLFLDLDWDHASWIEKKTEAESKCASIRANCRHGSRLAVVLLQERSVPTPSDDPLATERAHELCNVCQLAAKQLFVVPMLCNDLHGYITKLETAFHELAQGFYQQKLKTIRARSIPNNTPSLVVRQLFKLAFLSELRQDTHTALRNYRLAYEQCKESMDHWEDINIFEWRSVVGLLNYKWCELCFLHSTAVEAINQMRKHQATFFNMKAGVYPTPQISSIELLLWKAKQSYNFAILFDKAVTDGLTALPTLNPGSHLELAASIYSQAHSEIAKLKQAAPLPPYPSPDPLAAVPIFLGQRPWRVGFEGLAPEETEKAALSAIMNTLVVNHAGVIELLSAAMSQYKRYGCTRMQVKVVNEMGNIYYSSGDVQRALQLWCFAAEGLPPTVRLSVLQRTAWAAHKFAAAKEFIWCGLQLASQEPNIAEGLVSIFRGEIPPSPYKSESEEQAKTTEDLWRKSLSEKNEYHFSNLNNDPCLQLEASFLKFDAIESTEQIPVMVKVKSTALKVLNVSKIAVHFSTSSEHQQSTLSNDVRSLVQDIKLNPNESKTFICYLDASQLTASAPEIILISKAVIELFNGQGNVRVQIIQDLTSPKRKKPSVGTTLLKFEKHFGGIETDGEQKITCLVGEVAETNLLVKNSTKRQISNLKLEFKRNEQSSTAAAAVLFVDEANDLRSELIVSIPCPPVVNAGETISVPVRFAAQLVGDMDLSLEASHVLPGETQKRISKLRLSVEAKEPFSIKSQILTMNGVPVSTLLNHNEHIIKADITSNADIIVSKIEWLLADVIRPIHQQEETSKTIEEDLAEADVISFCKPIAVDLSEEDVETPLGRIAAEWHRKDSNSSVRSVVPLCRLAVISCPIVVSAKVDTSPAVVRQPIKIKFTLTNTTNEVVELTTSFELAENFMFCGDKKMNFRLLPGRNRQIDVVVMSLTGGRLSFPCPLLRSPNIAENVLQQALRSLPASLFVLPRAKEGPSSNQE